MVPAFTSATYLDAGQGKKKKQKISLRAILKIQLFALSSGLISLFCVFYVSRMASPRNSKLEGTTAPASFSAAFLATAVSRSPCALRPQSQGKRNLRKIGLDWRASIFSCEFLFVPNSPKQTSVNTIGRCYLAPAWPNCTSEVNMVPHVPMHHATNGLLSTWENKENRIK
jgi:hypothetical protein